jgi:hypothetical protein
VDDATRLQLRCHGDIDLSQPGIARCLRDYANGGEGALLPATPCDRLCLGGTLQFILHKGAGKAMRWPRAKDATNYYTLGTRWSSRYIHRSRTRAGAQSPQTAKQMIEREERMNAGR